MKGKDIVPVAIIKASYNKIRGDVVGGVCGTAFFVARNRALTAYHVLNPIIFEPNPGYLHCQCWLWSKGLAIPLRKNYLAYHQHLDTTVISLPENGAFSFVTLLNEQIAPGTAVKARGYLAGSQPCLMGWTDHGLRLTTEKPGNFTVDLKGNVTRVLPSSTILKKDVQIQNALVYELSCGGHIGLSGARS